MSKAVPKGFIEKHTYYGFMEKFKRLSPEDQAKVEAFVDSLDEPDAAESRHPK